MNVSTTRRILTIDGGGLKGTIPAAFLAVLEQHVGRPLHEYFDLLVGTSTGGIIAAGLAMGKSASEILAIYENDGPHIFPTLTRWSRTLLWAKGWVRAKYPVGVLRTILEGHFGDRRIGESRTRLVIPSWDLTSQTVHVWKTRHCGRFVIDHDKRIVDALVSTASAPTYFASSRKDGGSGLIDGGVWANNPMFIAAVEAMGVLHWDPGTIHMLSLGCVKEEFIAPAAGGRLRWAPIAAELFLQAQSRASLASTCLLLGDGGDIDRRIVRIEATAPKGHFKLDSADQIAVMRDLGENLARRHIDEVRSNFFQSPANPFIPLPNDAAPEALA
jgi:uncharacterized protein